MISVIVPVYNVEKYIRKCLDSIVNQTYRDLEIILIDDGSTDNSGTICDEYAEIDSRIKVIHKDNEGQSIARNIGLNNATGEFVGFVDSDDTIELNMFERLIFAIQDVDIAICGHNVILDGKKETISVNSDKTLNQVALWQEIFGNLNNAVWNKLFRRNLMDGIFFDSRFAHGEDLLFNLLYLSKASTGRLIDKPLYNYYKRSGSITTGKFTRRRLLEIASKDEALLLVKELYPQMEKVARKYCFRARMNIVRNIYKAKVESQYLSELKDYNQYIKDNYKVIKGELRRKERLEVILFNKCKCLYSLLARHYS